MADAPDANGIAREHRDGRGRYVLVRDGHEAELTYRALGDDRIVAEHTGVPREMGGTGAGKALVARLVDDARAEGVRIVPACSFVDAMRRRHPDWADAFAA
ncbi:hypothetical protein ATO8_03496 [Roseivivax marinus]|uniref:N-acetyltransferase domain-containing protein n=1 Tax=Roseivivax marinus TaxID=1379903 RepID=W4HNF3_9RHOB|nr:GNAT family N-acetyltransferase [Roseivivax marinus]ETW13923.1 hypothetical protein ATO8_03496 [Roseivivax marinus]SEK89360.1 hypothetical protein SAMN05444413_104103 [Roseivivax marinus]